MHGKLCMLFTNFPSLMKMVNVAKWGRKFKSHCMHGCKCHTFFGTRFVICSGSERIVQKKLSMRKSQIGFLKDWDGQCVSDVRFFCRGIFNAFEIVSVFSLSKQSLFWINSPAQICLMGTQKLIKLQSSKYSCVSSITPHKITPYWIEKSSSPCGSHCVWTLESFYKYREEVDCLHR